MSAALPAAPAAQPDDHRPAAAGFRPDGDVCQLTHQLGPELPWLASFRRRPELERHPRYRTLRVEIDRILHGFEWDLRPAAPPRTDGKRVRVVAWNIERGKRFESLLDHLQHHPVLGSADLLLLTEVDIGMGRSGNRNVPRELARALGMRYVFANSHLVLAPGDAGEQDHGVPNTLALHGNALLSRFPVHAFEAVSLPERTDKFHVLEKRLGCKRTLLAEVELPDGPLLAGVVHLDPFASALHRAGQLQRIIRAIERRMRGQGRVLLGGDLNTNTYDLGSASGLALNFAHKMVRFGFAGTVAQYLVPEQVYERPVFDVLARAGLAVDGYNDRRHGTIYYDIDDPELADKTRAYIPELVLAWLKWRLRPWDGIVPLRVDWFAGRGLVPRAPQVVQQPRPRAARVSDHDPIVVDLELG